jgi:hypothetical protein
VALTIFAELDVEQRNAIANDFIHTFSSPEGRRVLAHMLTELGFFDEIETEEEQVRHNYAMRILEIMNALGGRNVAPWIDTIITLSHLEEKV